MEKSRAENQAVLEDNQHFMIINNRQEVSPVLDSGIDEHETSRGFLPVSLQRLSFKSIRDTFASFPSHFHPIDSHADYSCFDIVSFDM
jgi:hypothetical protein